VLNRNFPKSNASTSPKSSSPSKQPASKTSANFAGSSLPKIRPSPMPKNSSRTSEHFQKPIKLQALLLTQHATGNTLRRHQIYPNVPHRPRITHQPPPPPAPKSPRSHPPRGTPACSSPPRTTAAFIRPVSSPLSPRVATFSFGTLTNPPPVTAKISLAI